MTLYKRTLSRVLNSGSFGAIQSDSFRTLSIYSLQTLRTSSSLKKKIIIFIKTLQKKILEAWNDVFADIVNVLLFNGLQVKKTEYIPDNKEIAHVDSLLKIFTALTGDNYFERFLQKFRLKHDYFLKKNISVETISEWVDRYINKVLISYYLLKNHKISFLL